MRTAFFLALLALSLGYAAWRGGAPERIMAGIAAAIVTADTLLHRFIPIELSGVDTGHLAIDTGAAIATTLLALFAYRFWPMIAAALHILPLLAHFSRYLDVELLPAAYLTMQVAASWLVPPLLLFATFRHRQRVLLIGRDRSWNMPARLRSRRMPNS